MSNIIEKNFIITKEQKESTASLMKCMLNLGAKLGEDIKIREVLGPFDNKEDDSQLIILKYENKSGNQ